MHLQQIHRSDSQRTFYAHPQNAPSGVVGEPRVLVSGLWAALKGPDLVATLSSEPRSLLYAGDQEGGLFSGIFLFSSFSSRVSSV